MKHLRPAFLILAIAALAGCGKSADSKTEAAPPATGSAPPQQTPGVVTPVKAPSRGPERLVYSFVDNRLAGHLTRGGGLVVPAGSAAFAKYVRFGNVLADASTKTWELRETVDNIKVARMTGKIASLFVPLSAQQATRGTIRLRMHFEKGATLSVRINDDEANEIHKQIKNGWQTIELDGAGRLREGENQIQLYVKGAGSSLAWAQIGGATAVDDVTPIFDRSLQSLAIPKGATMSWYVLVPDQARLTGDLTNATCELAVTATTDDGQSVKGKLAGLGSAVDLAALAGKPARIDLEGAGCADAMLANAALVVPGTAPPLPVRGDPPKYVLFWIMDSLRADRIKIFNPKATAEVPTFEKLAESSSVFLHHYSPGTESQVSHASMWTGMYLAKHKAPRMQNNLADKWLTIDEVAAKAGLRTAAASSNGYIRPTRGYGSSWAKFHNHILEGGGLSGKAVSEKGFSFVEPKKDQPWFLYIGTIDTHVTWRAKSPWIEKYNGGYKGRFEKFWGDEGPEGIPGDMTEKEIDHVRAIYDSNVSYQDDLLGKRIEQLKAWGVWDKTMLIVTADHGDELWEDGKTVGHAKSTRQTVIHIPLLIHYPPLFPTAKVASGTEGVDITPTLADALGVAPDPEWQGASLRPLAHGQIAYPQLAVSTHFEDVVTGRLGNWKLKLLGGKAPHLHDLTKDPSEKQDLWGDKQAAIAARTLLDPMWTMRQWNSEWKKSKWGNPAAVTSAFAADLGE